MGIFDAFTGGAERRAADRNRQLLQTGAQTNYDFLTTGTNRASDAFTNGVAGSNDYLAANRGLYSGYQDAGLNTLDTGVTNAAAALNNGRGNYDDLAAIGASYAPGREMYLNSLGLNGAGGNAAATGAFQAGPGYEWGNQQTEQALQRARAAKGMLGSGNLDHDTIAAIQGRANQEYGNWQTRLAGLAPLEMQAVQGAAAGRTGIDQSLASLYQTDAQNRLGVIGNATQGMAGANTGMANNSVALGNSLGNLYNTDATNRVGVSNNLQSGMMQANNQQAQGEAAGSRNLIGAGLSLASLAAGGLGGGSFGFGGGGGLGSSLGSLGITYGMPGTAGSNMFGPVR